VVCSITTTRGFKLSGVKQAEEPEFREVAVGPSLVFIPTAAAFQAAPISQDGAQSHALPPVDLPQLAAPSNNPANDPALRPALRPILRCAFRQAFHGFGQFGASHHALLKGSFDQAQDSPVGYLLAHKCHEQIMGDRVKVALDGPWVSPVVAFPHRPVFQSTPV
jgi:hypothetical protein